MPSGPITPKKIPQLKIAASPLASALEDDSHDDEESELSQSDLSASEDLSDEGDDDDDDDDDDAFSEEESGTGKEAIQRKALKADITPHHRLEKRPQRETAAKASSAWSHLASSSPPPSSLSLSKRKGKGGPIVEVAIGSPSRKTVREEGRGAGKRQVKRPRPLEVEVLVPQAGPSRSPRRQGTEKEGFIADALRKEKVGERGTNGTEATDSPLSRERSRRRGEGEEVHTPTREKKQVPRTPLKQDPPKTPSKSAASKRIADARLSLSTDQWAPHERLFIQPTSSDAYFAHHAPRSKRNSAKHVTSDSILSATFEPIPAEVVSRISHGISERLQADEEVDDEDERIITSGDFLSPAHYEPCFEYWWSLLVSTNRPLLVHGVGSKRVHLQTFARYLAREGRCSTIVIRGEAGGRIEDVVRELERCVDGPTQVSAASQLKRRKLFPTTLEARAHGLVSALGGKEETEEDRDRVQNHFLVLIHNFDTPLLLQDRSLHILSVLSACRRIHLCVDTCHINSSLLASLHADQEQTPLPWLWISMNTFVPQLEELINERGSGTSRAIGLPRVLDVRSAGGGGGGLDYYTSIMLADERRGTKNGGAAAAGSSSNASNTALLSERAAIHILRSVTSKARDLFLLLAAQLSKDDGANTTTYSDLASLASRNFKATNAEALRSLLVEFTTHNLIRVQGFDNSEQQNQGVPLSTSTVSIALSKRDLRRVYTEFTVDL